MHQHGGAFSFVPANRQALCIFDETMAQLF